MLQKFQKKKKKELMIKNIFFICFSSIRIRSRIKQSGGWGLMEVCSGKKKKAEPIRGANVGQILNRAGSDAGSSENHENTSETTIP